MKTNKQKATQRVATIGIIALAAIMIFAFIACKDGNDDPPPKEKTEQSYPVPGTKVTIKYMGFASDTEIPAEISKLAGIFTASPGTYSALDRTIYVIDGSAAVCSVRANSTMEAGSKWIIDTSTDDVDNAIYALRASWLA